MYLTVVHGLSHSPFPLRFVLTQSPSGGVIELDEAGSPTGIIKERATELITAAQQNQALEGSEGARGAALEQKLRFIKEGMALCARVGLTSVHSNDERSLE